jgi:hypothetical protein
MLLSIIIWQLAHGLLIGCLFEAGKDQKVINFCGRIKYGKN